jgi:hypothetical protein
VKRWLGIDLLAVLAGCVLVAALVQPWWSFDMGLPEFTHVYPYIMRGPATEFVGYRRTSQMETATYAMAAAGVLIVVGALLRGWKGSLPLALAGAIILVIRSRFIERIADMASRNSMPVEGSGWAEYESGMAIVWVTSRLGPGLRLGLIAGAMCLVAALLHRWVALPRRRA